MTIVEDREFINKNRDSPDYEAYAEEEERKRREDIKRKRMREKRKREILHFQKFQMKWKHHRRLQMKWKYHRRQPSKHRIKSLRRANNLRKRRGRI